ncbi:737_t:CDS:2, partial [Entrophospora sp. SA101]
MVKNEDVVSGTSETKTDTIVMTILTSPAIFNYILKNISVDYGCGELQIATELLAAAYENHQRMLWEIKELAIGLQVNEHIIMTLWSGKNTKTS